MYCLYRAAIGSFCSSLHFKSVQGFTISCVSYTYLTSSTYHPFPSYTYVPTIIELSTELCHQVNDQFDPVLLEDDNNYNKCLVITRCVDKSKSLTCGAPPWTALSAEQNRGNRMRL